MGSWGRSKLRGGGGGGLSGTAFKRGGTKGGGRLGSTHSNLDIMCRLYRGGVCLVGVSTILLRGGGGGGISTFGRKNFFTQLVSLTNTLSFHKMVTGANGG